MKKIISMMILMIFITGCSEKKCVGTKTETLPCTQCKKVIINGKEETLCATYKCEALVCKKWKN